MATNAKRDLEELKKKVEKKFQIISAALKMREKLLLRQIDVMMSSSQQAGRGTTSEDKSEDKELEFLADEEEELLVAIRSFGRFQLDNMNLAMQDCYLKNEDYITPAKDHETMYKCLQNIGGETITKTANDEEEQPEAIVVDFSRNKSLIEHNTRHMNESIINITLQEAKELIKKAKVQREMPIPPLNLEELDDELESSIAEAVSSLGRESPANTKSSQTCADAKRGKKNRFKPKITINNCNGTINLRNISSLTINCATEESVSADLPLVEVEERTEQQIVTSSDSTEKCKVTKNPADVAQVSTIADSSSTENNTPTTSTTATSSNYSSNSSSRSQSKKVKSTKKCKNTINSEATTQPTAASAYPYEFDNDDDNQPDAAVTCDFYNRLLNEIKNSLKEKSKQRVPVDNSNYINNANAQANAAAPQTTTTCDSNSNTPCTAATSTSATQPPGRRLVLKNFENLRIILEANSDEESLHPVQIEQWLAEIISETDQEPMQNTDILEHSEIHNEST